MHLLKKSEIILGVFFSYKIFQAIIALMSGSEEVPFVVFRFVLIGFWLPISYVALKGNKIALWIMGIILIMHISNLYVGLFVVPADRIFLKIGAVLLGSYLAYGGLTLIMKTRI